MTSARDVISQHSIALGKKKEGANRSHNLSEKRGRGQREIGS
jgi:hypothetical protein